MASVKGMDLDKLEAFRASIKANPVTLGLEARTVWEGHSGRSTVHIGPYSLNGQVIGRDTRHYTIPYGAWREVEEAIGFEGPTDRVEPVETGEDLGSTWDRNVTMAPGQMVKAEVQIHLADGVEPGDYGFTTVFGALGETEDEPDPLTLWNTLGSEDELATSMAGPSATALQALSYSPAHLGNGVLSDNDDAVVSFPGSVLSTGSGTITVWVKLVSVPATYPNLTGHRFAYTDDGLLLQWTANDGDGHSGWIADLGGPRAYSINTAGTVSTSSLGAAEEEVFLSMRWNEGGVPGHGDDKVVLYRNDVDVGTYFESAGATWPTGFTDDLKLNLADGALTWT